MHSFLMDMISLHSHVI